MRREGRFTAADREAVSAWLGRESHMPKPAHVMTEYADMAAALKESIAAAQAKAVTDQHVGQASKELFSNLAADASNGPTTVSQQSAARALQ